MLSPRRCHGGSQSSPGLSFRRAIQWPIFGGDRVGSKNSAYLQDTPFRRRRNPTRFISKPIARLQRRDAPNTITHWCMGFRAERLSGGIKRPETRSPEKRSPIDYAKPTRPYGTPNLHTSIRLISQYRDRPRTERAPTGAGARENPDVLGRPYFRRLRALASLALLVLDLLPFGQRPESFRVNVRVMNEKIVTAILGCNKSEPFLIAKPLHCTRRHYSLLSTAPARSACCIPSPLHESGLRGVRPLLHFPDSRADPPR